MRQNRKGERMRKNVVIILTVGILCFAAGVLAGALGFGRPVVTPSDETTASTEKKQSETAATAVPEPETTTEQNVVKPNTNATQMQTAEQKDNYGKEDHGDSSNSSQPEPTPQPDPEPTPEPQPDPEPDNSGDGEDMEWSPDIM